MNKISKKISNSLAIALLTTWLISCAGNSAVQITPKARISTGPRIELKLTPGPSYEYVMRTIFSKYTVRPQVAVWIETMDGKYIGTLYATEAAVTGKFKMAPKKGRPEALPVWSGRK